MIRRPPRSTLFPNPPLSRSGGAAHPFDPSPRDRARLLPNVSLNRLSNVAVHAEALGREPGKATLAVSSAQRPGHNTIGGVALSGDPRAYTAEGEVTRPDDFPHGPKIPRLYPLPSDVQGPD